MTDQPSTQEIRDKVQHLRDRLINEPQGDGFPPDGSVWLLDQVLALFDAPTDQPSTQEPEYLYRNQNGEWVRRWPNGVVQVLAGPENSPSNAPEPTTQEAEKALETVRGGMDSLAWLLNNARNHDDPKWDDWVKAARRDRERALAALQSLRIQLADLEEHAEVWRGRANDLEHRLAKGEPLMWIYKKSDTKMWTVGYYKPDGDWRPESDHNKKLCAAKRVSFLNGGRRSWTRCKCKGFSST